MRRAVAAIFTSGFMLAGAASAYAQTYASRPIRIVTSAPGGVNDYVARLIAPPLSEAFAQPVVIENRGGVMAPEVIARGTPDGYSLLLNTDNVWLAPLIRKTSYDPISDLAPIALLISAPLILVVHPSVPAKSVNELIAFAKAKPGTLNYGMSSQGSANHLSFELFKAMAGVNVVQISYKGSGPLAVGVLGGEVQMAIDTGASLLPHVKAGKLRALAVTSATASSLYPGLPTIAEAVPGYSHELLAAMFAPAKTPNAIIQRVNREVVRILRRPDITETFFERGIKVEASTPQELAATIKSGSARIARLIRDGHMKSE